MQMLCVFDKLPRSVQFVCGMAPYYLWFSCICLVGLHGGYDACDHRDVYI